VVRPERQTKADLAAGALIIVIVLVGAVVLWLQSDARATVSDTAPPAVANARPPTAVPATLNEVWRAHSPATPAPVVAGPAAVTGDGNAVLGRDPATGQVRWRYERDIPLCTVGAEWHRAIAVYRKSSNCSEVTSLQGSTGERGPQRNSDAEFDTRLLSDGTYVTATGRNLVETWRSDLVRTQQYGIPPAIRNSNNNLPRPQCKYSSAAVGNDRLGLIEKCPDESGDRVTMIKARPQDDEKPEEVLSTGVGSSEASVVTVTDERVAVVLRDRSELVVYNTSGSVVGQFPVRLADPGFTGNMRVEATSGQRTIYWHTGVDTVALDSATLSPLWTAPDTLGPGAVFGGHLLLPVQGGLAVHNPANGARERVIPVDRQGFRGSVALKPVGDVVLEQRGDTLVALR
jgi:hypothetical protein